LVFPQAVGVKEISDAVAAEIAKYLCNLFVTPPPAAGTLTAKIADKEVALHGFHIVNGKPTWF
jgi:hypothetical protein